VRPPQPLRCPPQQPLAQGLPQDMLPRSSAPQPQGRVKEMAGQTGGILESCGAGNQSCSAPVAWSGVARRETNRLGLKGSVSAAKPWSPNKTLASPALLPQSPSYAT
jgi:hypothetical protein